MEAVELAKAFEAFQQTTAELKEYYAKLEDRVAFLTKELERSKRLAAIGEMATTLAHEIRNPLGGIELSATVLKKELTDPKHIKAIENILEGTRRLNRIIQRIMDFARDIKANKKRIDLVEIVKGAQSQVSAAMAAKDIHFSIEGPEEAYCLGDGALLEQVFANLLSNACDAVSAQGSISVKIGRRDNKIFAVVKDNGVGISQERMDEIFNPFFTTKEHGAGLGLSIVLRILEAHKGELEVFSEEGKGSEFWVWLQEL